MGEAELKDIEERWNAATAGPWNWDINPKYRQVELETAKSLTVMDFVRWGMGGAAPRFRDKENLLHRCDEIMEPIPGREHHAHWAQRINHPDAIAIAAAPTDVRSLIAEVRRLRAEVERLQAINQASTEYPSRDPDLASAFNAMRSGS